MKRVDLNALRVFVTVAENGSFSAGAKALQMPSSNVSRQISQLEESLQLRLIQRSTRHMKLTSAGQTLLASMRPLLEQLAATEAELTQQQAEPEGPLRLCLPNEIGPSLFAPLMAQFALRYPKITVSCTTNLAGTEVLKEDVDIAVIITRGKMEDASVIARPLFSFPCCVVASPQLIARTGMPTNSEQLTTLPCITTVSALAGQAWQFAAADGSFILGCGIAGIAGSAFTMIGSTGPTAGQQYIVDTFLVVVFGGAQSLLGTLASAFAISQSQSTLEFFLSGSMAKVITLLIVVGILLLRPQGLFANRVRR